MTATAGTDLLTVTIDGIDVAVPKGTLLVEAAKQIHAISRSTATIPSSGRPACAASAWSRSRGCRSCRSPATRRSTDKMVVRTVSDKAQRRPARDPRAAAAESSAGLSDLRQGRRVRSARLRDGLRPGRVAAWPMPKSSKPKAVDLGPTIVLDEERCVLCLRCVRFDDLITRERSLRTDDRGVHAIIATATGEPYVSDFSGNVTELCPVGALTSKTYRFSSRPWDNHRTTTTCTQCSVGCRHARRPARGRDPAHDVRQRRRRDLRRLAVRPRPLQRRLSRRRTPAHAAALRQERRVGADRLGRRDRDVGRLARNQAAIARRDRRRAAARTKRRFCCSTSTGRSGSRTSIGAPAVSSARIPSARRNARRPRARAGDPHLRPPAGAGSRRCSTCGSARPSRTRRAADRGRRSRRLPACCRSGASRRSTKRSPVCRPTRSASRWCGTASRQRRAGRGGVGRECDGGRQDDLDVHHERTVQRARRRGDRDAARPPGARHAGDVRGRSRGKLTSLAMLGVNPVLHWPDRQLAVEALQAAPFVVVSDLFMTETAELATLRVAGLQLVREERDHDRSGGRRPAGRGGVPAPDAALGRRRHADRAGRCTGRDLTGARGDGSADRSSAGASAAVPRAARLPEGAPRAMVGGEVAAGGRRRVDLQRRRDHGSRSGAGRTGRAADRDAAPRDGARDGRRPGRRGRPGRTGRLAARRPQRRARSALIRRRDRARRRAVASAGQRAARRAPACAPSASGEGAAHDPALVHRPDQVGDPAADRHHDVRLLDAVRAQGHGLDAAAARPQPGRPVGACCSRRPTRPR